MDWVHEAGGCPGRQLILCGEGDGDAGVFIFGIGALWVIILGVISALATEWILQIITKRKVTILDGSAVITGLLLAYNLPPKVPFWLPIIGSFFAIAISKQVFGGLGQNIFNPALVGRVFLMASWPKYMTTFTKPLSFDAITSATPLAALKEGKVLDRQTLSDPKIWGKLMFYSKNMIENKSDISRAVRGFKTAMERRMSFLNVLAEQGKTRDDIIKMFRKQFDEDKQSYFHDKAKDYMESSGLTSIPDKQMEKLIKKWESEYPDVWFEGWISAPEARAPAVQPSQPVQQKFRQPKEEQEPPLKQPAAGLHGTIGAMATLASAAMMGAAPAPMARLNEEQLKKSKVYASAHIDTMIQLMATPSGMPALPRILPV